MQSLSSKYFIVIFNMHCLCKTDVNLENTNSLVELENKTKKDAYLILLCCLNISVLSHEKSALSTAFNTSIPDPRIDLHSSCNMSSSCGQTQDETQK